MSYKSYVPGSDAQFLDWAENLTETALQSFEAWKIPDPEQAIGTRVTIFKDKLVAASQPNRGKVDVLAKNEARKDAEKALRTYVQAYLAKNPLVTNVDRGQLRITIYDTTPTAVPPPTIPAEADLLFPATAIVKVANIRPLTGSADKKAEYGVRIYYGVMGTPDETDRFRMAQKPQTGIDLPHSVFTRRRSHRFQFTRSSGKEVFFCLRYENSKGEAGPWGNLISAFIP